MNGPGEPVRKAGISDMAQRILATDDEADILMIIRSALQSEGFEVETASSGAQCIESALANPLILE